MFFLKTMFEFVLLAYLPHTLVYADPVSYKRQTVRDLTPNPGSCEIQVVGFEAICPTSTDNPDGKTYIEGRVFNTTIRDTGGVVMPFDWTLQEEITPLNGTNHTGAPKVRSPGYGPDADSNNCNPIQVMFYRNEGLFSVRYVTPGKGPWWWVDCPGPGAVIGAVGAVGAVGYERKEEGGLLIPIELLDCIPDPEKLATDEDIDLQVREILISKPGFSDWDQDDEHNDIGEDIDEFIGQQDEISLNCTWGRDSNLEDENILFTI
ncbi:hypothetical protein V502_00019 [Pseudogymnoascus sp. VKM F-4520 (FW-2644)]|nr:hypothetical protein V502_00019 [Pseudogymnoascus sp. VKM F-4520 (FW-2644)]